MSEKDSDDGKFHTRLRESVARMLSVAALIFTVNFGIITLGVDSEGVITSIRIPVMISGALLLISIISGTLLEVSVGRKDMPDYYHVLWPLQGYSFFGGLISVFVAVLIRLDIL